jgi:hypothetical protein
MPRAALVKVLISEFNLRAQWIDEEQLAQKSREVIEGWLGFEKDF